MIIHFTFHLTYYVNSSTGALNVLCLFKILLNKEMYVCMYACMHVCMYVEWCFSQGNSRDQRVEIWTSIWSILIVFFCFSFPSKIAFTIDKYVCSIFLPQKRTPAFILLPMGTLGLNVQTSLPLSVSEPTPPSWIVNSSRDWSDFQSASLDLKKTMVSTVL